MTAHTPLPLLGYGAVRWLDNPYTQAQAEANQDDSDPVETLTVQIRELDYDVWGSDVAPPPPDEAFVSVSPSEGELLLAAFLSMSDTPVALPEWPDGFVEIASDATGRFAFAYKMAGPDEPSEYTIGASNRATWYGGISIARISGISHFLGVAGFQNTNFPPAQTVIPYATLFTVATHFGGALGTSVLMNDDGATWDGIFGQTIPVGAGSPNFRTYVAFMRDAPVEHPTLKQPPDTTVSMDRHATLVFAPQNVQEDFRVDVGAI